MSLENEVFKSRVNNYLDIIKEKVNRLIRENINDIDMVVKFANGDFYAMAHEEFAQEYKQGLYDNQCMKIC